MELSRKEETRNKRISLGVTVFSFIVMLLFLIFKNVITSNPSLAASSIEMSISSYNGSENNNEPGKKTVPVTSEKKQTATQQKELADPNGEIITIKNSANALVETYKNRTVKTSTEQSSIQTSEPATEKTGTTTFPVIFEGNEKIGFNLPDRNIITAPKFTNDTKEEGKVMVEIVVDKNGDVIEANPNGRGTTTSSALLKAKAKQMAIATKFSANQKLEEQRGMLIINFSFN